MPRATTGDPEAAGAAALDALHPGGALGLAVSGGGDSAALMRIAAGWAQARGVGLRAACVDHGLRPEAAEEAAQVAALAASLGIPCDTLRWRGWDGRGNLQAAARSARSALLSAWAAEHGLSAVALGHTLDDQAETVLMRIARGAGVDGLSGMAPASGRDGALWLRPLLGLRRAALREWLARRSATWIEDPSNDDPRFERVRVRAAMTALEAAGVSADALAAVADRMQAARGALDARAASLWSQASRVGPCGDVALSRAALADAPEEIGRRLLARALRRAGGAWTPRPRAAALGALLDAARSGALGRGRTLAGCVAFDAADAVIFAREHAAAARARAEADLWDGRWRVRTDAPGAVAALGEAGEAALMAAARAEGWRAPQAWRAAPRAARLSTPALWRGEALACAPLAGYGDGLMAVAYQPDVAS
ncbi:tRNA lysidine(34) synthetase TilS [Rubrimonas cliftonensis]|uniref:tRNA(Ile)-lysidine synthase n=1 Tax=Rubrimonas cliftonensis TaxID=89524 RepID=A0A1H4BXX7_9RHOB|nr:tRNA lysidine(34) synthetase TilS [Rubrimonas cliftonensis]SEA52930.1 tRNA(Ile)-lysidine synthase [Rubrimonas cliftonensis]